ncbi:hypothetical protein VTI74DRAFT_4272 [Chaetomium olivicolor]
MSLCEPLIWQQAQVMPPAVEKGSAPHLRTARKRNKDSEAPNLRTVPGWLELLSGAVCGSRRNTKFWSVGFSCGL